MLGELLHEPDSHVTVVAPAVTETLNLYLLCNMQRIVRANDKNESVAQLLIPAKYVAACFAFVNKTIPKKGVKKKMKHSFYIKSIKC